MRQMDRFELLVGVSRARQLQLIFRNSGELFIRIISSGPLTVFISRLCFKLVIPNLRSLSRLTPFVTKLIGVIHSTA
jgi:hypothetical protein